MSAESQHGTLTPAETPEKWPPDVQRDGLEWAPDATLLIRPDGVIVDINHYAETLFGYRLDELVGQNMSVLIPERFRNAHARHSAGYIEDPRPRSMGSGMDLWGLRKDGSEFPVDISLSPQNTPKGTQIVCSVRDLSARLLHAVGKQLAFEKLVTDISARFARIPFENVDEEIIFSLKQIVEFLGVDRSSLGEFSSEGGILVITHSYALSGFDPVPRLNLDEQFPWYASRLRRGEIVRCERLPEDLPLEAKREREYITTTGFKAVLTIPISMAGATTCVLSVGSFRSHQKWPDEVVRRLRLLGEIFAGALARSRAQQALQESEAKFRLLAETATCAIGIYQGDRFRYINPQAAEITGYSVDELLSMNVERLIHPDHRAQVLGRAQARLRGEAVPARYEVKILTKEGEERWVDFAASVTQYKGRPAIIGTAFDVTERKRAEESLHELSGRLIQDQEEERTHIARELHDDLSQRLALLSIGLEEADHQTAGSAPALQEHLRELGAQTREIGTDIHRLSHQLHPSQLEVLGLVPALRGYCSDISRQKGLAIEFTNEGVPLGLSPDVSLCLYRIVQEGLQNVCKHSGARRAKVALVGDPEALRLTVVDDGKGFDPAALGASAGLGLVSMRERVRLVHGDFSVHSQPGRGTRLEVRIPLSEPSA
jgi:PAS domain S-box-containing protein